MAIDALCTGTALLVMMMFRNIEFRWQMAFGFVRLPTRKAGISLVSGSIATNVH
jgi:hypothetical protein